MQGWLLARGTHAANAGALMIEGQGEGRIRRGRFLFSPRSGSKRVIPHANPSKEHIIMMNSTILRTSFCAVALLVSTTLVVSAEVEQSGAPVPIADQVAALEATKAFMEADSDIREAWLSIAKLTSNYCGLTEGELLSLPGIQSKEEKAKGHSLYVKTQDSDGTVIEFGFDRSYEYLTGVRVVHPDGDTVGVSLAKYYKPDRLGVAGGYVIQAESRKGSEFVFASRLTHPELAYVWGPKPGGSEMQGRVILWAGDGELLADRVVSLSDDPRTREGQKWIAIQAARAAAGIASPKDLLLSSSAYKGLDSNNTTREAELRRAMNASVSWSADLLNASPDDLVKALHGEVLESHEEESERKYVIKARDKALWTVAYERPSGQLTRAIYNDGGLALYYGYNNGALLLGALTTVSGIGKDDYYWLISFYPGKFTPRMAIAAVGTPAIDPNAVGLRHSWNPPSNVQAQGEVFVWNPEGAPLVKKEFTSATPLEKVLADIEAAIPDTGRSEIGWQGPEAELRLLLGTK